MERAFPVDAAKGHGFVSNQRMGMDIFAGIDPHASLVFATAAWQYSHHVLPGMRSHRGPILTVANWSGQWPGLVGLLNLNGSLIKAGVPFSTLWSEDFADEYFRTRLQEWIGREASPTTFPRARPRRERAARIREEHGRRARRKALKRKGDPRHLR